MQYSSMKKQDIFTHPINRLSFVGDTLPAKEAIWDLPKLLSMASHIAVITSLELCFSTINPDSTFKKAVEATLILILITP